MSHVFVSHTRKTLIIVIYYLHFKVEHNALGSFYPLMLMLALSCSSPKRTLYMILHDTRSEYITILTKSPTHTSDTSQRRPGQGSALQQHWSDSHLHILNASPGIPPSCWLCIDSSITSPCQRETWILTPLSAVRPCRRFTVNCEREKQIDQLSL